MKTTKRMEQNEFHTNISAKDYRIDSKSISQSALKKYIKDPFSKFRKVEFVLNKYTILGTFIDECLFSTHNDGKNTVEQIVSKVIKEKEYTIKKGCKTTTLANTLTDDYITTCKNMLNKLFNNINKDFRDIFKDGKSQVSIFSEIDGIKIKGRLDYLKETDDTIYIIDYKTTNYDSDDTLTQEKCIISLMEHYEFQGIFYKMLVENVLKAKKIDKEKEIEVMFVFQNASYPYNVYTITLSEFYEQVKEHHIYGDLEKEKKAYIRDALHSYTHATSPEVIEVNINCKLKLELNSKAYKMIKFDKSNNIFKDPTIAKDNNY